MGSNTSTRRITLQNEGAVLEASEAVLDRITKGGSRSKSEASTKSAPPSTASFTNTTSMSPPPPPPILSAPSVVQSSPSPLVGEEYSVTSLKMRQQKAAEMRQLDTYWKQRLAEVEKKYLDAGKISQEEFNRAVSEVESLVPKIRCNPICRREQRAVQECFDKNVSSNLNCSSVVSEFSRCVSQNRLKVLASS